MSNLQQKYFVKQAYSASTSTMTSYVSSLGELRKNASNENGKIIESEIYLAESFIYQNKALAESAKLNYAYFSCASKEAKSLIEYLNMAKNSTDSAAKIYSTLSDSQKLLLRPNYKALLTGYEEQISSMQEFVSKKC
jgi:hypothetical protein